MLHDKLLCMGGKLKAPAIKREHEGTLAHTRQYHHQPRPSHRVHMQKLCGINGEVPAAAEAAEQKPVRSFSSVAQDLSEYSSATYCWIGQTQEVPDPQADPRLQR